MGILSKTALASAFAGTSFVAYLGASTTLISPLARDDSVWTSKSYKKLNIHKNPATQDVVIKRIPLSKIKPELLQKEGDLVQEFCRGVWSGWGYHIQRAYLARKYKAETPDQLWTIDQLSKSKYEVGTKHSDHFEILDKTPTEIVVRGGDTPRNPGPRDSDGLFIVSAEIDRQTNEAVLGLKSCFFNGRVKVETPGGPMPSWMEELHQWYSRVLMVSGASWVTR